MTDVKSTFSQPSYLIIEKKFIDARNILRACLFFHYMHMFILNTMVTNYKSLALVLAYCYRVGKKSFEKLFRKTCRSSTHPTFKSFVDKTKKKKENDKRNHDLIFKHGTTSDLVMVT